MSQMVSTIVLITNGPHTANPDSKYADNIGPHENLFGELH